VHEIQVPPPVVKSASTLWVGLSKEEVYKRIRRSRPDSNSHDHEFFNEVYLLGTHGRCILKFDSNDRLLNFIFSAPKSSWNLLLDSCKHVLGIPSASVSRYNANYRHVDWEFTGEWYFLSENDYGCDFSGDKPPRVAPPINVPPPPPN